MLHRSAMFSFDDDDDDAPVPQASPPPPMIPCGLLPSSSIACGSAAWQGLPQALVMGASPMAEALSGPGLMAFEAMRRAANSTAAVERQNVVESLAMLATSRTKEATEPEQEPEELTTVELVPATTPKRRDPNRPRRAYNITQALVTRRRNEQLRRNGIAPPPPYIPKKGLANKRKYERTGRYRGATLQHGGKLREFSSTNAPFYSKLHSRFCASNAHVQHSASESYSPSPSLSISMPHAEYAAYTPTAALPHA